MWVRHPTRFQFKTDGAPFTPFATGTANHRSIRKAFGTDTGTVGPGFGILTVALQCTRLASPQAIAAEGALTTAEIQGRITAIPRDHDLLRTGRGTVHAAGADFAEPLLVQSPGWTQRRVFLWLEAATEKTAARQVGSHCNGDSTGSACPQPVQIGNMDAASVHTDDFLVFQPAEGTGKGFGSDIEYGGNHGLADLRLQHPSRGDEFTAEMGLGPMLNSRTQVQHT